jgi:hypothetical protein
MSLPDYQEVLRQQRELRNKQRLTQAAQTAPLDYDRNARIFHVAAKTRLPAEVVDKDLDKLHEQTQRDEFNYLNYTDQLNGSPIFNEWAAENPYNYAVVERDRRSLTTFERQLDSIHRGVRRGEATIELARIANRRRAGDEREGDEEILEDMRQLVGAGDFGLDGLASVLVETGVQGKIQGWLLSESWEMAAGGFAVGAAAGALAGPAAPITAPAAAGIGGAVGWRTATFQASRKLEQGLAYDEYIQLGADEADAKLVSEMVGVANGALEMVGLSMIVKNIPGAKKALSNPGKQLVEKMFAKPGFKQAAGRLAYRYGESMAGEIVTEILQESITIAGGEYLKGEMREAGDIRPETAAITYKQFMDAVGEIAVQTMKGTAIIGGIGPGGSFLGDLSRAKQARANGAFIRSLGEVAEKSETRKNVGPKWREYLQRQQERGPVKELRFDAEAWTEYWTAQDMDPVEVSKELGVDLENLDATGGDVVIDLETVGDKLAHTDHFTRELWKDVRTDPDAMTYREARRFFDNPESYLETLKADLADTFGAEVSDDVDKITEDLTGQLVAMNYDQSAAEKQAKLMSAVFTTQALRNPQANMTPWEMYESRLAGVRADVVDPAAPRGAFDITMDPLLDRLRSGDLPTARNIFGDSLMDFVIKAGGIQDQGGELSSRDLQRLRIGLVNKRGDTLDGMAEKAHEAGYIPVRDPDLLVQMLDRESKDDPVYAHQNLDINLHDLNDDLQRLSDYLESEGIDVNTMSNQEIREALDRRRTFEQSDDQTLGELTELVTAVLGVETETPELAQDLAKVEGLIPRVAEAQDFGEQEFTDRVRLKGKPGTRTRKVQTVFDREVKKRNMLKTLLDCLGRSS